MDLNSVRAQTVGGYAQGSNLRGEFCTHMLQIHRFRIEQAHKKKSPGSRRGSCRLFLNLSIIGVDHIFLLALLGLAAILRTRARP
jgi:hypothetical protein